MYPDLGFGSLRPCTRLRTGGNIGQSVASRTQTPANHMDGLVAVLGIWREKLKVNESEARASNDSKVHSESSFTFAYRDRTRSIAFRLEHEYASF